MVSTTKLWIYVSAYIVIEQITNLTSFEFTGSWTKKRHTTTWWRHRVITRPYRVFSILPCLFERLVNWNQLTLAAMTCGEFPSIPKRKRVIWLVLIMSQSDTFSHNIGLRARGWNGVSAPQRKEKDWALGVRWRDRLHPITDSFARPRRYFPKCRGLSGF